MPFDAARMKKLRIKRGLTQRGLAAKLGLHYQEIQRYERIGDSTEPKTARLEEIARALETSVAYLTGHTDDYEKLTFPDLAPDERELVRLWRGVDPKTRNRHLLELFREYERSKS